MRSTWLAIVQLVKRSRLSFLVFWSTYVPYRRKKLTFAISSPDEFLLCYISSSTSASAAILVCRYRYYYRHWSLKTYHRCGRTAMMTFEQSWCHVIPNADVEISALTCVLVTWPQPWPWPRYTWPQSRKHWPRPWPRLLLALLTSLVNRRKTIIWQVRDEVSWTVTHYSTYTCTHLDRQPSWYINRSDQEPESLDIFDHWLIFCGQSQR